MTRRLTILIAALSITAGGAHTSAAGPSCQVEDTATPHQHVRVSDPQLAAQFEDGLRRSMTLRTLVGHVESFRAFVYIRAGYAGGPSGWLTGAMSHEVVRSGGFRFVKIDVWPNRADRTVATIGHELQHAVEVLDADVSGQANVTDFYKRIGTFVRTGVYETSAAQRAGSTVLQELSKCKLTTDN